MVDWTSVRGRVTGLTGTWPGPGRVAPWAPRLPDVSRIFAQRVLPWLAAEVAPGRLMPWLPVAFGAGIAIYFAAAREPARWAPVALAAALAAILQEVRMRAYPTHESGGIVWACLVRGRP